MTNLSFSPMKLAKYSLSFMALASPIQAEEYGKFQSKQAVAKDLSKALSEFKADDQTLFHTAGVVTKVCEKKGCWMTLEDKGQSVRVVFKGYSFFVGKVLEGKRVVAEGYLKQTKHSVSEQKHLLKDAGADAAAMAKIKEPTVSLEFEATAVKTI